MPEKEYFFFEAARDAKQPVSTWRGKKVAESRSWRSSGPE
jgi:hypothetical protein